MRTVRFIAALFAVSFFSIAVAFPAAAGEAKKLTVLELFTSQGCSSCPPADRLLGEYAKRADVLALSFPVSYWDHLGWRDTLAKEAYNKRQRLYADARGDREIYTPQIVVNGIAHAVGSHKGGIEAAIANTGHMLQAAWVPLSLSCEGGSVRLQVGDAPDGSEFRSGRLWLVIYSHLVPVDIGRGENTGREVVYTNVVRQLVPAGKWTGAKEQYEVDIPDGAKYDGCAALLQADKTHAVLGATVVAAARKK